MKRTGILFYSRTREDRGKNADPFHIPSIKEIQKHETLPKTRRSPKRNSVGSAQESRSETMVFYPGSHPAPFPGSLTELRIMMEAKAQGKCPECGKKNCSCDDEEEKDEGEEFSTPNAKKTKDRRKAINKAKKEVFKKKSEDDEEDDESKEKRVKAWMGESVNRTLINQKLGIQESVKKAKPVQRRFYGIKENRWSY